MIRSYTASTITYPWQTARYHHAEQCEKVYDKAFPPVFTPSGPGADLCAPGRPALHCWRAGLPRMRFHDLRHTAATLLLGRGVNPKIVSEMLGHASIAFTLDSYSHALPDMQAQAAVGLDAALGV